MNGNRYRRGQALKWTPIFLISFFSILILTLGLLFMRYKNDQGILTKKIESLQKELGSLERENGDIENKIDVLKTASRLKGYLKQHRLRMVHIQKLQEVNTQELGGGSEGDHLESHNRKFLSVK